MRELAIVVLACCAAACGPAQAEQPHERLKEGPEPTENWLGEEAEAESNAGRERWLEELHRAPPDVDWRAIERANGEREQARRNALARGASKAAIDRWTEIGSSNLAGRTHVAALSPDGTKLYAGSSLGGLWRAAPDGSGWTPLGDNLFGGVYDLSVLPGEFPGDPEVIACRTGSNTLRVTRDQGLTWESPSGLNNVNEIRCLAQLATTPPTLLLCAQVPGAASNSALYVSLDYGRTFTQRWKSPTSGGSWMWVPRRGAAASNTIWIARKGEQLRSTDSGFSFQLVGAIDAGATDVRLCGSEAGAPTLYAMVKVSNAWQLKRSDNAGLSFALVHTPSDYWGALCASSLDPSRVLYGGVEAHRSVNGGASFQLVNSWGQYYGSPASKLHADIQGISCQPDPSNPQLDVWFVDCDGGTYRSTDGMQSVANLSLSGLGISQYYSTHTSRTDTHHLLAGAQDQGFQFGYVQPSTGPGPSTPFTQLISGDYGHLTSGDGTHALVYTTYPGFLLIYEGVGQGNLYSADFPATNHSWLPPVVADPLDLNATFFCGDRLWRYLRSGNQWIPTQYSSFDFTAGGSSYLSALAFSPADPQRAWAATDTGKLYRSIDHGLTWQPSSSSAPGQHYFYGTAIAAHPDNPLEAAVGGSGYGTAGVVRTTDGGVTWQPEVSGLPSTMVYALAYAPDGSGNLYAATEAGPWCWERTLGAWTHIQDNEAPLTTYWSVEAVEPNLMRFGTYGRGAWDYETYPTPGWSSYGSGKTTSLGGHPTLNGIGSPTLAQNDFQIELLSGVPGKPGLLMFASEAGSTPFLGGTLWLKPPVTRGPGYVIDSIGYAVVDLPVTPELIGTQRCYQAWFRDPNHPDGTGVGLSDALAVVYGP